MRGLSLPALALVPSQEFAPVVSGQNIAVPGVVISANLRQALGEEMPGGYLMDLDMREEIVTLGALKAGITSRLSVVTRDVPQHTLARTPRDMAVGFEDVLQGVVDLSVSDDPERARQPLKYYNAALWYGILVADRYMAGADRTENGLRAAMANVTLRSSALAGEFPILQFTLVKPEDRLD